jgi:hypothetical protein
VCHIFPELFRNDPCARLVRMEVELPYRTYVNVVSVECQLIYIDVGVGV